MNAYHPSSEEENAGWCPEVSCRPPRCTQTLGATVGKENRTDKIRRRGEGEKGRRGEGRRGEGEKEKGEGPMENIVMEGEGEEKGRRGEGEKGRRGGERGKGRG